MVCPDITAAISKLVFCFLFGNSLFPPITVGLRLIKVRHMQQVPRQTPLLE